MGVADYLVKNHAAIARVVFPTAVGFGFIYTVKTGRNPLEDASAAARGAIVCRGLGFAYVLCDSPSFSFIS